jgi:ribosome maturation factor RimP
MGKTVMGKVEDRVMELARQVAEGQGVTAEDVQLLGRGRRTLLRVTIDKEGGVTLDDCEAFSRDIEALLDVEDPMGGPYTLEVSSPGLDRPLRNINDFRKNTGKLARVITRQKIDNQSFFVGRIAGVDDKRVRLLVGDREVEILLVDISRARLEVEMK